MERNIENVVEILKKEFNAKNIFTLNDEYFRRLEGLEEKDVVYLGKAGEEIIDDGKIKYKIDFTGSQKTGFYFDQCDNREFIERFVKNKSVLDAFCNSGGFGMHSAYAGASSVTFVESSEREISNTKYNYMLNDLKTKSDFVKEDVFDYLEQCINQNVKFDVVMLDPPSFVKNKKNLPAGIKGYVRLNRLALQVISNNGNLVTSSCSYHFKRDDFINAVNQSALKSGRKIQLLYFSGASLDHPQIPAMEETSYLKFAVFRVW
jgi:23S rRNA (cytosine1962-C5)-methyltransferase